MTTKLYYSLTPLKILFRQLWLSVTKADFYHDVYRFYHGYGLKYIFTIAAISGLVFCVFILNYIFAFKDYFSTSQSSPTTETVDYLIKQFSDFDYDGTNIRANAEAPVYLFDQEQRKVAVIDIAGTLPAAEKIKIPILFTANKMILTIMDNHDKKRSVISVDYFNIFGKKPQTLTAEVIKKEISKFFSTMSIILMIIGVIAVTAFYLLILILQQGLLILLAYILVYLVKGITHITPLFQNFPSGFGTYIRMVLFSSGAIILLQPLILFIAPTLSFIIGLLQLWTSFLVFLGILKAKQNN